MSGTITTMVSAFALKSAKEGTIPRPMVICNSCVYRAEELRDYDVAYFYGCANIKHAIAKKGLTDADYLFAYERKNEWVSSHTGYNKAKLFFKEHWVLSHVPKLMPEIIATIPNPGNDSVEELKVGQDELREITLEEAPPVLVLKSAEKFKDVNGRVIEIETRGERVHNRIFFKVKDVAAGFGMANLSHSILNKTSDYHVNKHYRCFITTQLTKDESHRNKNTNTAKELFFTYNGIVKVLFCSNTGSGDLFVDWAMQKLFALHLGTAEQKATLATELMAGADVKSIKQVIGASSAPLSAIYLFCIGRASALLPDSGDKYAADDFIYKFGYTCDIKRRTQEHAKTFAEEFGANITLPIFSVIDKYYISEAESRIARHFDGLDAKLEYKNYDELVVLNKKKLANTADVYSMLQRNYAGDKATELLAAKKEMEDAVHREEVSAIKREHEMDKRQREIEKEMNQKEREIIQQERELENKRHELEMAMIKNGHEMERKDFALGLANAKIEMLENVKKLVERENALLNRENEILRGVFPLSG